MSTKNENNGVANMILESLERELAALITGDKLPNAFAGIFPGEPDEIDPSVENIAININRLKVVLA